MIFGVVCGKERAAGNAGQVTMLRPWSEAEVQLLGTCSASQNVPTEKVCGSDGQVHWVTNPGRRCLRPSVCNQHMAGVGSRRVSDVSGEFGGLLKKELAQVMLCSGISSIT